jgi:hypothetical protein
MVLPAGEYAVFDVNSDCRSEDYAIESRFADIGENYRRRELFGNNLIIKCHKSDSHGDGEKTDTAAEIWVPVYNLSRSVIPDLLRDKSFDYISPENREFICAFDKEMEKRGYGAGNIIVDGICWGRNMLIYSRVGAKSPGVAARIYMKGDGISLRMFLNNVTSHSGYIANSPEIIKGVFTGKYGTCKHCKGDNCKFRKDYKIEGVKYEKCNGVTFKFYKPTLEGLSEYVGLFDEFFALKKGVKLKGR